MFSNEGVLTYTVSSSKIIAQSFVNGFIEAKNISTNDDDDILEDYWTCVDNIEPIDEQPSPPTELE